jgi:methyltransferase (TIGR00027 family)
MQPGRPSRTAAWVATLRGMASASRLPIVEDPVAKELVPRTLAHAIGLVHRWPRAWQTMHGAINVVSFGHIDHIALRTRAIDDGIAGALQRGTRQLVLLGAGLDARAWRLPALHDATVLEVDFPATQAYKRKRIGARAPLAHRVEFVAMDFQRDVLSERLRQAGLDTNAPSIFVWEGVTMYLSREDVDRTLSQIASVAAPGSLLLATYLREDAGGMANEALHFLVRSAREPFRAKYTQAAIARAVEAHGFTVRSDEGDREWVKRYRGHRAPAVLERLMIAEKTAS